VQEDHKRILDVSGKIQERRTVIASLRSQITELHGKIREKKVRTQGQERQVQQLHESVIGFQERCRQMTEIVRAKKVQRQGGSPPPPMKKDGVGSSMAQINQS
jgi:hypothetical protein